MKNTVDGVNEMTASTMAFITWVGILLTFMLVKDWKSFVFIFGIMAGIFGLLFMLTLFFKYLGFPNS